MVAAKKHVKIVKKRMSTLPSIHRIAIDLDRPREKLDRSCGIHLGLKTFADEVVRLQTRSNGRDIRATASCALIQAGGSQRVSITECEDDSRAKLLCHRYVQNTRAAIEISRKSWK
jgi:hypothetical protein